MLTNGCLVCHRASCKQADNKHLRVHMNCMRMEKTAADDCVVAAAAAYNTVKHENRGTTKQEEEERKKKKQEQQCKWEKNKDKEKKRHQTRNIKRNSFNAFTNVRLCVWYVLLCMHEKYSK